MARFLGLLLLLAVVLYGIWPYYSVWKINTALEDPDPQALAPVVDLAAIQAHYKARVGSSVDGLLSHGQNSQTGSGRSASADGGRDSGEDSLQFDTDKVLGWLAENIKQLGDAALDQAITLDWVRGSLLAAVRRADSRSGGSFIGAVDFAFFEAWDRFVIRLGKLGADPTFVTLSLEGREWQVTDITH